MHLILLTHERELAKKTNTGALLCDPLPGVVVSRIEWARKNPNADLLTFIDQQRVGLLYPSAEVAAHTSVLPSALATHGIDTLILIDSTWQEARKIYNRSAYLHELPRISLPLGLQSQFNLRRNQREGGLCTAECAALLMSEAGFRSAAQVVELRFSKFLSEFGA